MDNGSDEYDCLLGTAVRGIPYIIYAEMLAVCAAISLFEFEKSAFIVETSGITF